MGLFGKREPPEPEPPPGPKPITEDEVPLDVFEKVVLTLCSAIGSRAQVEMAIDRLRTACGMVPADKFMANMSAYQADPGYFDPPGRWLGVGAAKANAEHRPELAVLAYVWIFWWSTSLEPKLSGGELTDLGLNRTRREDVDALIAEADVALPLVDPDTVLARAGSGEELSGRMVESALASHKSVLKDIPGQTHPAAAR